MSRVTTAAMPNSTAGVSEWLVEADYRKLHAPVKFEDLREDLRTVEPEGGPMHERAGLGKGGDLYPFNWAALELVLGATASRLPEW